MTCLCREKGWKHYFKVYTMFKSVRKYGGEDVSHKILHSKNLYHPKPLVADLTMEELYPDLVHFASVHCKPTLPVMKQGWWLFPLRWVVASMLETSSNLHDSGSIISREEFVMTREHSTDLFSSCQKPPPYKEQNINSKLVIALPQHTACDCRWPSFCRHTPHPDGLGNSAWGSFAEVMLPQADLQ